MTATWRIDPEELAVFLTAEIGGCEMRLLDGWLLVRPDPRCRTRRYKIERPAGWSREAVFAGIARIAGRDLFWAEKRGRAYRNVVGGEADGFAAVASHWP